VHLNQGIVGGKGFKLLNELVEALVKKVLITLFGAVLNSSPAIFDISAAT
jgi:hypothetical protein